MSIFIRKMSQSLAYAKLLYSIFGKYSEGKLAEKIDDIILLSLSAAVRNISSQI